MQTIKKPMAITAALVTICMTLFSFTPLPGGENYRIYINKKLVVEQFVSQSTKAAYLPLTQKNLNDKIDVYYNHCGSSGTARHIVIRDEQNQVVKDLRFADATSTNVMMTFDAKDILVLQKGENTKKLYLFYASKEYPAGKLLAIIAKQANASIARL